MLDSQREPPYKAQSSFFVSWFCLLSFSFSSSFPTSSSSVSLSPSPQDDLDPLIFLPPPPQGQAFQALCPHTHLYETGGQTQGSMHSRQALCQLDCSLLLGFLTMTFTICKSSHRLLTLPAPTSALPPAPHGNLFLREQVGHPLLLFPQDLENQLQHRVAGMGRSLHWPLAFHLMVKYAPH